MSSRDRGILLAGRKVDDQHAIAQRRKAIWPGAPGIERQLVVGIVQKQDRRVVRPPFDAGDDISAGERKRDRSWFGSNLAQLTPHPSVLYFFAQSTPCQVFIEIGFTKKSQRGSVNVGTR